MIFVICKYSSMYPYPYLNWPNSQIPECTCSISQNAPFRTEMCTFLFWMEHSGIWNRCILGFKKIGLFWIALITVTERGPVKFQIRYLAMYQLMFSTWELFQIYILCDSCVLIMSQGLQRRWIQIISPRSLLLCHVEAKHERYVYGLILVCLMCY